MAPTKKTKKTADSINSRLALVMKSGKGSNLPQSTATQSQANLTVRKISSHSGLQVNPQVPPIRQSQACHHRRQHPAPAQERARVYVNETAQQRLWIILMRIYRLLYALQDQRPPLRRKQRKFTLCACTIPHISAPRQTLRSIGLTQRKSSNWDFGGCRAYTDSRLQIELGTACGKLYRCSTMAVLDAGDSDILSGATA